VGESSFGYLLLEIFDDDLLVAIHPAGNAHQEEGERIHGEIIPSACWGGEHFVGKRAPYLPPKRPNLNALEFVRVFGQYAVEEGA
jgi:hypothetical protein